MWILESTEVSDFSLRFLPGRCYKVGRKDSDILFSSDQSVSRHHAILEVSPRKKETDSTHFSIPSFTVCDCKSMYGTTLNGTSITETTYLKENDVLWFGRLKTRFRVLWKPITICFSNCDNQTSVFLLEKCQQFGFIHSPKWVSSCDILVMNSITATIKFMLSLVKGSVIVTPSFFLAIEKEWSCVGNYVNEISSKHFPPITDENLSSRIQSYNSVISFEYNPQRCKLFENFIFISFFTEQFDRIQEMIHCAAGKCLLFSTDEQTLNLSHSDSISCHLIIVSPPLGQQTLPLSDTFSSWLAARSVLVKFSSCVFEISSIFSLFVLCNQEELSTK
eukprot:Sdes_comp20873_c0_seq3m17828